jgi:phage shock protein E
MNRVAMQLIIVLGCLWLTMPSVMAGGEPAKVEIRGDLEAASLGWELLEQGALLIDVRSAEEFEGGSIESSLNIPHSEIDMLAQAIGDELDRKVVFFCGSGKRAERAKTQLEALGYTGIFNASGYDALLASKP